MLEDVTQIVQSWLRAIGERSVDSAGVADPACPLLAWAASGVMDLTGEPDRPPIAGPLAVLPLLTEFAHQLSCFTERIGRRVDADPALVLGGRAAAMGLTRQGRISAGGATRLLPARDGWCAVSLARPSDLELVPAILGSAQVADPWEAIAAAARTSDARRFAARVQRLAVPAAALPGAVPSPSSPWRVDTIAQTQPGIRLDQALVVDLSSLWAGPLCAHLLALAGADVIKVESTERPDGARAGSRTFFDWLHAGHRAVAVDFTSDSGRAALTALVQAADVVIEASRPRALANLGLAPESLAHRPGKVWISITGYGRSEPDLVAFGDDAAVAGGLVGWTDRGPVFCADAVADPLTGLAAALAATASLANGGGQLIDLAMKDVAACFAGDLSLDHGMHRMNRGHAGWGVRCPLLNQEQAVLPPRAPHPAGTAPALGADTALVLAALPGDLKI